MFVETGDQCYLFLKQMINVIIYFETGDQDQVLSATKLQIPLWTVSAIFILILNQFFKPWIQNIRSVALSTVNFLLPKFVNSTFFVCELPANQPRILVSPHRS